MSSRKKKPDARALFKQAKGRKEESSRSGVGRSAPNKYKGMTKEQMLALLVAKKAGNGTGQKTARCVSPPKVQVQRVKAAPTTGSAAPKGQVLAGSGGLTDLLGIGAADSSSDDDEEKNNGGKARDGSISSSSKAGKIKSTAPPPNEKGLPEGFFDEDVEPPQVVVGAGGRSDKDEASTGRQSDAAEGFGPKRAAELAAEAAAEAEADAARDAERLAALKAAGAVQAVAVAAISPAEVGDVGAAGEEEGEAAPKGSALPEGFFDDPEVDAKSRGVDLKAKKKQEEQSDWKEFMSFAEEVKKVEKEEEQEEEAVEEDKEQYEELEQATMMGRLAVLMNKFESVGHKRRRPSSSSGGNRETGDPVESGSPSSGSNLSNKADIGKGGDARQLEGMDKEEMAWQSSSARKSSKRKDVEMSVEKTVTAMREVAVASAPMDAAAADIASMLKGRKRKQQEELEEAFAGEYVPMDPLNWRARGR